MIELILSDRCLACGLCVQVCPKDVLETADGRPAIVRQDDCQTCFMCELYCKVDAIYVAAEYDRHVQVDERQLIAKGLLGQFRKQSGWDEWAQIHQNKHHLMEQVFARATAAAQALDSD